jgi:hypothetical protein
VRTPLMSLVAVAGVLALGTAVGSIARPEQERALGPVGEKRVPVRSSVAVCPNQGGGPGSTARVAAAIPPGGGNAGPGDAAAVTDLGGGPPRLRLDRRGAVSGASLAPGSAAATPALVGRAGGALAPGFSVQHTVRTPSGGGRGLASLACGAPDTGYWFLGTSTATQRRSSVYLTNSEQAPATVDVLLYGPDGRLDISGGRGLVVAPGKQREVLLAALAPGVRDVAVNVVVRSGRVAAALRDQELAGSAARGVDWVPPVAEASRRAVVPPAPAGGGHVLYLLAPGDDDGTARIKLVGKDGPFTPVGAESVEVIGGELVAVDLEQAARGEPVAVLVDADVPVLAGTRLVRRPPSKLPDVAFLASTGPLVDAAVVADSRAAAAVSATLHLSAPEGAVRAAVTTVQGEDTARREVSLTEGTTLPVVLAPPRGRTSEGYSVIVEPLAGSGPLYGSWALSERTSDGELFTARSLVDTQASVAIPRVAHDLSAGIRPES